MKRWCSRFPVTDSRVLAARQHRLMLTLIVAHHRSGCTSTVPVFRLIERLRPGLYDGERTGRDCALLSQLKDMHDQVRATIEELAEILSATSPDLPALARTRMKLTRLSGK